MLAEATHHAKDSGAEKSSLSSLNTESRENGRRIVIAKPHACQKLIAQGERRAGKKFCVHGVDTTSILPEEKRRAETDTVKNPFHTEDLLEWSPEGIAHQFTFFFERSLNSVELIDDIG
jgi:hypothetical protein